MLLLSTVQSISAFCSWKYLDHLISSFFQVDRPGWLRRLRPHVRGVAHSRVLHGMVPAPGAVENHEEKFLQSRPFHKCSNKDFFQSAKSELLMCNKYSRTHFSPFKMPVARVLFGWSGNQDYRVAIVIKASPTMTEVARTEPRDFFKKAFRRDCSCLDLPFST